MCNLNVLYARRRAGRGGDGRVARRARARQDAALIRLGAGPCRTALRAAAATAIASPATAAADRSEDGAAAWELSLQRSSLPFRHVAWDLQGMSMAVGAGVIVVSIGWHVHRLRSRRTSDQTLDAVSLSVSVCCSVLSRS